MAPEKQLPETATSPEKQLLAHAPPGSWRVPPEVVRCYEEIVSRFILPREVLDLLVLPETIDSQLIKLMKVFKLYPDDYPKLILFIRNSRGIPEGSVGDEILIRMYGMENTRNFLLASAMTQQALGKNFEWERDGARPKVPLSQTLQFALKAQHAYQGRAVDLAFASGLIFDNLIMTAHKALPSSTRAKAYIADAFEEGLLTAKIGLEVCRRIRDLKLVDYVFSACILRGVGKCVAAILTESAMDCFAREARDFLPLSSQIICEEELYGVSSDFYGSLICSCFPILKPIQDALHFQRKPYLLRYRDQPDLGNLASTVCLASNMAQFPVDAADEAEDPVFIAQCAAQWLRPEVRDLGLNAADLFQVAQKIGLFSR